MDLLQQCQRWLEQGAYDRVVNRILSEPTATLTPKLAQLLHSALQGQQKQEQDDFVAFVCQDLAADCAYNLHDVSILLDAISDQWGLFHHMFLTGASSRVWNLLLLKSNKSHPYVTALTLGLMPLGVDAKGRPTHVELMMRLPPKWKMGFKLLKDPYWGWPSQVCDFLQRNAYLEQLGSESSKAWCLDKPLVPNTDLCALVLLEGSKVTGGLKPCALPSGMQTKFYQLVLLNHAEYDLVCSGEKIDLDYLAARNFIVDPKHQVPQASANSAASSQGDAHKPKSKVQGSAAVVAPRYTYTPEESVLIDQHIRSNFGKPMRWLMVLTRAEVQVEVGVINPHAGHPYYTLVTKGLGAYSMRKLVPPEYQGDHWERFELVLTLPPYWKVSNKALKELIWKWPLCVLRDLGSHPFNDGCWFGPGHSLYYDSSLLPETELQAAVALGAAKTKQHTALYCGLPSGEHVNFYHVLLLHRSELQLGRTQGWPQLVTQLKQAFPDFSYVVDPLRPELGAHKHVGARSGVYAEAQAEWAARQHKQIAAQNCSEPRSGSASVGADTKDVPTDAPKVAPKVDPKLQRQQRNEALLQALIDKMEQCVEPEDRDLDYSEAEFNAIVDHIVACAGEPSHVFTGREIPDIKVDVAVIEPSEDLPYYTLVTIGLGAYQMKVPPELKPFHLERAELVMMLPPDWKMDGAHLQDERWFWPFRVLKSLAHLAALKHFLISVGYVIDGDKMFASNTKLCGLMPLPADAFNDITDTSGTCELPNGELVNFYFLIPLYRDEVDYSIRHGCEWFLQQVCIDDVVVDLKRPSLLQAYLKRTQSQAGAAYHKSHKSRGPKDKRPHKRKAQGSAVGSKPQKASPPRTPRSARAQHQR